MISSSKAKWKEWGKSSQIFYLLNYYFNHTASNKDQFHYNGDVKNVNINDTNIHEILSSTYTI